MLGMARWRSLAAVIVTTTVLAAPFAAHAVCPPGWTCDCEVQTPYPPTGARGGGELRQLRERLHRRRGQQLDRRLWQLWPPRPLTGFDAPGHARHPLQRIDIPEPATGKVDQKAGVYQQVYVVPGQTYTLTADVYMSWTARGVQRAEHGRGRRPGRLGDTHIGEGSVKWSSLQGDKNAWRTVTVSTTSVFEVMTVYVVGWRKYVDMDNGRIWIDKHCAQRPVPTQSPSPPEEEPEDPTPTSPTRRQ